MSEQFDDLLGALVDSASSAAREPGPEAARQRGRQRRNRRRLAASTLSLALLGAAGGIAAVSAHGSNALPTAHGPLGVTHLPSPAASSQTGASASPSATAGLPIATGSSAATQPTATVGPSITANPNQYVAGAWLSGSQMPLALPGYTDWQLDSNVGGTRVGGEVFATNPGQSATWCMDMGVGALTGLADGLEGGQIQMFSSSTGDKIRTDGIIPADAHQAVLFYQNAADADAAMGSLAASFATCKNQITGVDPTTGTKLVGSIRQTATQPDAQCWTVLALGAVSGPGTLDHDCFVQSGSIIELVNVEVHEDSSFSTQSFAATDTTLIPELRQDLQQY